MPLAHLSSGGLHSAALVGAHRRPRPPRPTRSRVKQLSRPLAALLFGRRAPESGRGPSRSPEMRAGHTAAPLTPRHTNSDRTRRPRPARPQTGVVASRWEPRAQLVSVSGALAFWRPPASRACPAAELVGLEGAHLRLNVALLGRADSLRLEWTLNGRPLPPESARLRQRLLSRAGNGSAPEVRPPRRAAAHSQVPDGVDGMEEGPSGPADLPAAQDDQEDRSQRFWLAPYLDRRPLARSLLSAPSWRPQPVPDWPAEQAGADWRRPDEALSSASGVDWNQLETLLAGQAAPALSPAGRPAAPLGGGCSASGEPVHAGESQPVWALLQVHLLKLEPSASGQRSLYQLRACAQASAPAGQTSQHWFPWTSLLWSGPGEGAPPSGGACRELASFQLQVLEDAPQLVSKPERQLLEPGDRLSLKCSATGFTLPQISWFLDGQQLSEPGQSGATSNQQLQLLSAGESGAGRLRIGDYVSQDSVVHSFVNASYAQPSDAGLYRCLASNGARQAQHLVRLDVRGPPQMARPLPSRLSALAGEPQLSLQCPYTGWPIGHIHWFYRAASGRARRQPAARSVSRAGGREQLLADYSAGPDAAERDEWLSQAGAASPAGPEDYPEPVPEQEYAQADYAMLETDLQQQENAYSGPNNPLPGRSKRQANGQPAGEEWLKLPQSRRHQLHPNGTLLIRDLARQDQGLYRCRVVAAGSDELMALMGSEGSASAPNSADSSNGDPLEAVSSSLQLNVLVAPVISPFGSAENLREGMRNFLTCSVIEGEPPVRIRWLKEQRAIEHYIAEQALSGAELSNPNSGQARIRLESNNEYTSTLYFSHVDFKDNGNYTCIASNKAASVNYTAKMVVNVPPKWTKAPKDVDCVAGQAIVIDCQAQAYPNARVWWELGVAQPDPGQPSQTGQQHQQQHQQQPQSQLPASLVAQQLQAPGQAQHLQAPNHYRTITSNSRIHILENASLVIREVQRHDQGFYLCQAANNFGSLSALIKLTVNVGASFASKYLTKYVRLNERAELDCDPAGQWPLEAAWFMGRPGQSNLSAAHLGEPFRGPSQAALGPPPRRLFAASLRPDEAAGAGPAERAHELAASPEEPTLAFELVRRGPPDAAELLRLLIGRARRSHSADYLCRASNRWGADEKLVRLLVQEPPDPVLEVQVLEAGARSLTLTWAAPFDGHSPITAYTLEWALAGSGRWSRQLLHQNSHQLQPLEPQTGYEIRVRAQNQLGQSAWPPSSLLALTREEAPSSPAQELRALPLSSSAIQLTWLAPAPSSLAGAAPNIKGYYVGYRPAALANESFVFKAVPLAAAQLHHRQQQQQPHHHQQQQQQQSNNATSGQAGRLGVQLNELKRNTAYLLIVQPFNSAGPGPQSDPLEARTLQDDPPPAPQLRVGTTSYTSLELLWSFGPSQDDQPDEPRAPLLGYRLYYRPAPTQPAESPAWLQRSLSALAGPPDASTNNSASLSGPALQQHRYLLDGLACGRAYQAYLVAMNSVGASAPSQSIRSKTRGGPPIAPRRQDFISANSSWAQLNLEAWMDAGCAITAFQIRYRRLNHSPGAKQTASHGQQVSQNEPTSASLTMNSTGEPNSWLLLATNLSPEQRALELRDLEPESWYSLETVAQSEAGKTQVAYSFMTLDRLGRLPVEAQEYFQSNSGGQGGLPALFRSGSSSIRSILSAQFSAGPMSPMLLAGACSLLLIATCALLLVRRYNHMLLKESAHPQEANGYFGEPNSCQPEQQVNSHSGYMQPRVGPPMQHHCSPNVKLGSGAELYSLKGAPSSPCKTATTSAGTASLLTGSSANSAIMQLAGSSGSPPLTSADLYGQLSQQDGPQSMDRMKQLSRFLGPAGPQLLQPACPIYGADICSARCEDSPRQTRFATLNKEQSQQMQPGQASEQQINASSRFKTLPHRPLNSFMQSEPDCQLNSVRYMCPLVNNQQTIDIQQQQLAAEHQRLYSKLRLICNSHNSNCGQQSDQTNSSSLHKQMLTEQVITDQQSDSNCFEQDAISLALLAHQNQKMATGCSLKRNQQQVTAAQQNLEPMDEFMERQTGAPNGLASMLMLEQSLLQQADPTAHGSPNNAYGAHCQVEQANARPMSHQGNSSYPVEGYLGLGSNSLIAPAAQPPTPSFSGAEPTLTHTMADQLISLAQNSSTGHLVIGSAGMDSGPNNGTTSNSGSQVSVNAKSAANQAKLAGANSLALPQAPTSEQSDYALPFPPKWV